VGGDKFSAVWCQPIGMIHIVGREREYGGQCNFADIPYEKKF